MDAKTLLEKEYPLKRTKLVEGKFDDDISDKKDEEKKPTPKKDMKAPAGKNRPKVEKKSSPKKAPKKEAFEPNRKMGEDDFATISSEDFRTVANHFNRMGTEVSNKISDRIMEEVYKVLLQAYEEQGIDAEVEAHEKGYASAWEMIEETDAFEQYTTEIAQAFIEGFDQAWFYPLS